MNLNILTMSYKEDDMPRAAERVLTFAAETFGAKIEYSHISLLESKRSIPLAKLPDDCISKAKSAQAVLFLASTEGDNASEIHSKQILADLSKTLKLCAKVRKALGNGGVCTLVCDAYRGFRPDENGFRINPIYGREAYTTEYYGELEIERVARIAYEQAMNGRRKLALVDMGRNFAVSSLWRKIVTDINEDYPYVNVNFSTPEQAAIKLVSSSHDCDVILCPSVISEGLSGILSAISDAPTSEEYLGETALGIYACLAEAHTCNPMSENERILAILLSCADMLDISFGLPIAKHIKNALYQIKRRYGNNLKMQANGLADEIISEIQNSLSE